MIETVVATLIAWILATAAAGGASGEPLLDGFWAWALPVAYVAIVPIVRGLYARVFVKRIAAIRRGQSGFSGAVTLLQVIGFAALCNSGWAQSWFAGRPNFELAALMMPWFAAHALSLFARRAVDQARTNRAWSFASYWHLHLRLLLLPTLLVLLLLVVERVSAGVFWGDEVMAAFPILAAAMVLVAIGLSFVLAPFFLRIALPTRTLAKGVLRDRLEALAANEGFKLRDIRVIETDRNVVNAALVGLMGWARYVFFSDGILDRLDEDDLVGVFAHEMGHAQRRHLLLNFIMLASFIALMTVISTLLLRSVGVSSWVEYGLPIVAMPAFLILFFFPTTRAFETEADVYAGEVLGGAKGIHPALSSIARLFPSKMAKGGILHPSLSQRLEFLTRYFESEDVRSEFRVRGIKLRARVLALAACAILVWGAVLPGELSRGGLLLRVEKAYRNDDEALAKEALVDLDAAVAKGREQDPNFRLRMPLWQVISTEYQDRGDYEGAEFWLDKMRAARDSFAVDDAASHYSAAIILAQQAAAKGRWPAFSRELDRAAHWLEKLELRYETAPRSLLKERIDLGFLRRGVQLLERRKVLVMTGTHPPLPALPLGPEYDLICRWTIAPDAAPLSGEDALDSPAMKGLKERWRRDFLLQLAAISAPRKTPSNPSPDGQ
ncbi:MAG: M48 family metalloprotease [Planctomycetota bacterium]